MAVPRFNPVPPTERPRYYASPDHVPEPWVPDRAGEIEGFQPEGPQLAAQGPDQGYALRLASELRPKLQLQPGENGEDVIEGCLGVALRRASLYSRAPVVHDLNIAFTIWGFYDPEPPTDLLAMRRTMFESLRLSGHHYTEKLRVSQMPPEATLRMTPAEVNAAYPAEWRTLVGV